LLSSTSRLLSEDVWDLQEHHAGTLYDLLERKEDLCLMGMMDDGWMNIASMITRRGISHSRYKTVWG